MNNIDFNVKRIAQGYANRPWLHKQVMEQVINENQITTNFRNGLDVGCGAGLSTKALRLFCEKVTGTDVSEEMIAVCHELYQADATYEFYVARAEETLVPEEKYDVVTAAGMVNWVDRELFLKNMDQILESGGLLVIYDFWITDKMKGNGDYTNWYQNEYLVKFPKPPRNERIWKQEDLSESFLLKDQINQELTYQFDLDRFIDFMMIQSNVNVKIENNIYSEAKVRTWMRNTLSDIFKGKEQTLVFQGYHWDIIKK